MATLNINNLNEETLSEMALSNALDLYLSEYDTDKPAIETFDALIQASEGKDLPDEIMIWKPFKNLPLDYVLTKIVDTAEAFEVCLKTNTH